MLSSWNGTTYSYSLDLNASGTSVNLTGYAYLSFRACQMTQHALNIDSDDDLTFSVRLEDGAGAMSDAIGIGVYGGGIQDTFQRIGSNFSECGATPGWASDFEVVRIRLTDFTHDNPSLDLSNIAAIRFDFGSDFGSSKGRIALDEIEITSD
ncbi:MAG TPA: hypothetical protein P5081_10885 [Phycisphaerae bacterium]|nr:hypothetical protein [Phycisphaerae bacterium]HRW53384.1 hypothetical protein [Phycisphaerae bacterium]